MSGGEISQSTSTLRSIIRNALEELERDGEIVICSSNPNHITDFLNDRLRVLTPTDTMTPVELAGLRSLVYHAINDKRFFDWEMPTLTGLTAEEFANLAAKLPTG
ncbi:hypothetical protein [Rhizobium nepotum]|jgi:hypothetical protein|uniref:hypothetical protein n=1 Tax=Rhizobium nepotum TaxID=1035271 RepID=UPI00336A83C4